MKKYKKLFEKQRELIEFYEKKLSVGEIHSAYNFKSELRALEQEPDQDLLSDKDIEEWIKADANWSKTFINGAIYGAKAMRDGWIKSNRK